MEDTQVAYVELSQTIMDDKFLTSVVFDYLDERGVENIFGAPQALVKEFSMSHKEAVVYTEAWYGKVMEGRKDP